MDVNLIFPVVQRMFVFVNAPLFRLL